MLESEMREELDIMDKETVNNELRKLLSGYALRRAALKEKREHAPTRVAKDKINGELLVNLKMSIELFRTMQELDLTTEQEKYLYSMKMGY